MHTNTDDSAAKAHFFQTQRTARYYTLGQPEIASQLWVVLHGYGQLPRFWVRKFYSLAQLGAYVVAPEGLSRFYLGTGYERVGASWMTKEDRETEIADYLVYLDGLLQALQAQTLQLSALPVHVLGFSQGAATAWRWANLGEARIDTLTLWAGMVQVEELRPKGLLPEWNLVRGKNDTIVPEEAWEKQIQELASNKSSVKIHSFSGEHEINKDTIHHLFG